ncbi:helix-turn-helix domain-containing protein [Robinsoniella peoriensis]|uniref:helix-turn-helix domain-containing protein n=1 Tax=Robinsoniella peoriensis TaxID=180332 RepID=UPI0005C7BEF0|nr:helix-turn-helix transcriptional regulator [Robinsoniella peoriensis]
MASSYKKLWKLLIDKEWKKKDLEERAQISHYTMNKLNHGRNVTTDVLERICCALDCSPSDIMEFISAREEVDK